MLELKKIVKDYQVGEKYFRAVDGIDLKLERGEFVSILGESGSGKSTTLNIIGGLDQHTSGDLVINGESTNRFESKDWDSYRNNSVGFIFQHYNLISHLSVIDNVEITLALSGMDKSQRTEKAKEILKLVGLESKIYKKPNLLSGGEQQRVVIARALVGNPDIILADEPTGALDSKTSTETLDLIKKISKDKLVVMVTHNTQLAKKYSTRIVQMSDGKIIDDYKKSELIKQDKEIDKEEKPKKISMNYLTAAKLSLKNLETKWKRTLIASFAGSVGIIGIALVLSIQSGITNEMASMQESMFASMPSILITDGSVAPATDGPNISSKKKTQGTSNSIVPYNPLDKKAIHHNILSENYLHYISLMDSSLYSNLNINMDLNANILIEKNGSFLTSTFKKSSFVKLYEEETMLNFGSIILGRYPNSYNEAVLIIDEDGEVDQNSLIALGIDLKKNKINYDDVVGKIFVIPYNDDFYEKISENNYKIVDDKTLAFSKGLAVTITGVLQIDQKKSTFESNKSLSDGIGYLKNLDTHLYNRLKDSSVVISQKSVDFNVFNNQPFVNSEKEELLKELGGSNIPKNISITPKNAEASELIKEHLDEWNSAESDKIIYTDKAAAVSAKISKMVNITTLILISFAATSLIVSSIMIGIITYVSTIERTKEIGILRSLGASKKDISRIINAETAIIGLVSGIIGITTTLILSFITNSILNNITGMNRVSQLSIPHILILIGLSIILTVIAGLIPSKIAAQKDPVKSLQSE